MVGEDGVTDIAVSVGEVTEVTVRLVEPDTLFRFHSGLPQQTADAVSQARGSD